MKYLQPPLPCTRCKFINIFLFLFFLHFFLPPPLICTEITADFDEKVFQQKMYHKKIEKVELKKERREKKRRHQQVKFEQTQQYRETKSFPVLYFDDKKRSWRGYDESLDHLDIERVFKPKHHKYHGLKFNKDQHSSEVYYDSKPRRMPKKAYYREMVDMGESSCDEASEENTICSFLNDTGVEDNHVPIQNVLPIVDKSLDLAEGQVHTNTFQNVSTAAINTLVVSEEELKICDIHDFLDLLRLNADVLKLSNPTLLGTLIKTFYQESVNFEPLKKVVMKIEKVKESHGYRSKDIPPAILFSVRPIVLSVARLRSLYAYAPEYIRIYTNKITAELCYLDEFQSTLNPIMGFLCCDATVKESLKQILITNTKEENRLHLYHARELCGRGEQGYVEGIFKQFPNDKDKKKTLKQLKIILREFA